MKSCRLLLRIAALAVICVAFLTIVLHAQTPRVFTSCDFFGARLSEFAFDESRAKTLDGLVGIGFDWNPAATECASEPRSNGQNCALDGLSVQTGF